MNLVIMAELKLQKSTQTQRFATSLNFTMFIFCKVTLEYSTKLIINFVLRIKEENSNHRNFLQRIQTNKVVW